MNEEYAIIDDLAEKERRVITVEEEKTMSSLFKRRKPLDLRAAGAAWVANNIGDEFVDEFCEKYDALNSGIPIGGLEETIVFLDLLERIRRADDD